jgi:hypothetical protein
MNCIFSKQGRAFLRCLYIENDNRFIFLTEIKNVGKLETDIDV